MKPLFFRLIALFLVVLLAAMVASQGREPDPPDRPGPVIRVTEFEEGYAAQRVIWKLVEGTTYVSPDRRLSLEEVVQIRETVLRSEHEDTFEGFELAGDTLTADGKQSTDAGSRFSLTIDLGGEPNIKLSCKKTKVLVYLEEPDLETLPNWQITVGDRYWNTRSRNVASAIAMLCRYPGIAQISLNSLEDRFSNLETPLSRSCREWTGFPELNRKLKLIDIRETPTAVHFEFKVRKPETLTHVAWSVRSPHNHDNLSDFVPESVAKRYISLAHRHGYYFDPEGRLNPDWRPLLQELERAEKFVPHHAWLERLKDKGIIDRVRLTSIHGLTTEYWPLETDPDLQLELCGRGWSDDILISSERGLAFAPALGPDLCTALAIPGYTGRKPKFTPDGTPIRYRPENGARAIIKTDGTSTLLSQW